VDGVDGRSALVHRVHRVHAVHCGHHPNPNSPFQTTRSEAPCSLMHSHRSFPAGPLLLLVCFLAFTGCSSFHNPFAHPPELAGSWANRLNSVVSFNPNGTFEINHAGRLRTSGTYALHKNVIELLYTGGKLPWDGHETATYRIKQDHRILRFVLLHDTCAERIANFSVKWKKI